MCSRSRLIAEGNVQIDASENVVNGANGGTILGTAGGAFTVNAPMEATTILVPTSPLTFNGAGGLISLTALGGPLTVNSRIQVSSNDPDAPVPEVRRSASGGMIILESGLTTGTGISLSSTASLLSLLNATAPGPGGSISLTTAGSDIISNGATIQADRGTIALQHSAAPSVGTAQITLDGGTIQSETLLASSRGNLNVGTTLPVNLMAVTISLLATNNVAWDGGTLSATAVNSSGNVTVQAGNDIIIDSALLIERFNGGITDGLNLTINAGGNLQAASTFNAHHRRQRLDDRRKH